MLENVVTVWCTAGGTPPGLANTQIPYIAIAHHCNINASTNNDMARTAACFIFAADDCFPSDVFSAFSKDRSFTHVKMYSVVFMMRMTESGSVVRRN
jgi:hypothetical protein